MKLLLTPRATQNVVEEIPVVPGFIPVKSDVHILCCMDGQTFNEHHHVPFDYPYYTELFLKLCTRNNHVVQRVHLSVISFFESSAHEFAERLRTCDLFFFAGFNRHAEHVESIFKKTDESMNEKRTAVANRVVTNRMTMWAVGASAIFCGSLWNYQFGGRSMPSTTHVMFGLLGPNGNVKYNRCSPGATTTNDPNEWQITSATALIIVSTSEQQVAQAFVCVERNKHWYTSICALINNKCAQQIPILCSMVTAYSWGKNNVWYLEWGPGLAYWKE